MDTPTTKDYIDARIETVNELVNGEMKAHRLSVHADMQKLEQTVTSEAQLIRKESDLKYAQIEAQLHKIASDITKSQNELIKWVVGALFTSSALTISTVSFLLSQSPPRSNAPIVIYAQPAPPAPQKTQP